MIKQILAIVLALGLAVPLGFSPQPAHAIGGVPFAEETLVVGASATSITSTLCTVRGAAQPALVEVLTEGIFYRLDDGTATPDSSDHAAPDGTILEVGRTDRFRMIRSGGSDASVKVTCFEGPIDNLTVARSTSVTVSASLPPGASTSALQTSSEAILTTIDADTSALFGTVAGSEQQVDVVTSALPAGAATEATLASIESGVLADIFDELAGEITPSIQGLEGDFNLTVDNIGSIVTATAGLQRMGVQIDNSLTALPDADGDLAILRVNSIGQLHVADVGVDSVVPQVGTLNLGKTEDALHSTGSTGVMSLGVANTSVAARAGNGDYVAPALSTTGVTLSIPVYDAAIMSTLRAVKRENDPFAGGEALIGIGVVRDDVLSALVPPDGDFTVLRVNNIGELHVGGALITSIEDLLSTIDVTNSDILADTNALVFLVHNVDSVGGATDGGNAVLVLRDDVLTTLTPIDGDYVRLRVNSVGALHVTSASLPLPTGAATEATLSGLNSKIPSLGAALIASSQPVNIASDQTVPISAASLPLPTGAATSALQTTGNAILTTIDADTSALFGTVSGSEQQVDIVASLPAGTNNIGDVDVLTVPGSGSSAFTITDTGIAAVSQNFAFGFTSQKVILEAPSSNTADVCIDHAGGTAVCPAADTAGDDRIAPGVAYVLDNHAVTSVSAISASGTQTITVRAFN